MKAILARKIGMTQVFDEQGKVIPVTLLEAGPAKVLRVRTLEKDGYEAVQLGFGTSSKKKYAKVAEFRGTPEQQEGDILASVFEAGDKVKVAAISKGKGFQGAVKKWGFAGRNKTHGVKHEHRTLGSTGGRFPQRVIKGRKMPGRTGDVRVTVKNMTVVRVDADQNVIALKGAIPGTRGSLVEIRGV